MLSIGSFRDRSCEGVSRRAFLKAGFSVPLALGLGGLAILILVALLARPRWLLASGFSPLWGAFTFPVAAFSSLMQMLGSVGDGEVFRILGGLALVAATLGIPVVMWKVVQLWGKGQLAVKTNAAEA